MIYIEIRCENRNEDNPECLSHTNDDEHEMSADTQKQVLLSYRILTERALKGGYVKLKGEWICPSCADFLGLKK